MTYTYEALGPERFQQLCQAILVTLHSNVQCLPVAQPDGGRDALLKKPKFGKQSEAVVFQVKFSRDPSTKAARDVVEDLIASEHDKVNRLTQDGVTQYYFMTNVRGTSFPDAGSIDRVNAAMTTAFNIPSFCFWRDDLDRRIDVNSSIKWSFPEILRGSDILQALYEGRVGADAFRRLNSVRSYLTHQYGYDAKLKFKQVNLEKGLLDLFVDIPAAAIGPANERDYNKWFEGFTYNSAMRDLIDNPQRHPSDEGRIGAVEALLDVLVSSQMPRIIIEGAPGQGKTTITQFLCQINRMVMLDRADDIQLIPAELRPTSIRFPLRVDLRDYATWLSGKSPFHSRHDNKQHEPLSPTLESFLAAQIASQSGGTRFDVDDLLTYAKQSSLLIVLDGFDEVADIPTRNSIVREVSDASSRLAVNSMACQTIVTSRPASFANSPGFPQTEWQYIQILPLTRQAIDRYKSKWLDAHSFDYRERNDISVVLNDKLEQPHVRLLARNPMQLAILLALIWTQGPSLPDQRTTLYDRYMDILFNREAEKSRVIRDKRQLIISMHRFLAWKLHVEAESNAEAGIISESRLREVLKAYLTEGGHDAGLIDDLFRGAVERVGALVGRVQGTFEFEVQPLREYFAARYLYDTAPHVRASSTRRGSIIDRFDAIARNAYWLNVSRFYCGCYNTGELPSLVEGLIEIDLSDQFTGTTYVVDLAIALLTDYVFSQQPRSVARLGDFLFERKRFHLLLAKAFVDRFDGDFVLPEDSGRQILLKRAMSGLIEAKHMDTVIASLNLARSNLGSNSALNVYRHLESELEFDKRFLAMAGLGVMEHIPVDELLTLVRSVGISAIRSCVYGGRRDIFDKSESYFQDFVTLVLDGRAAWIRAEDETFQSRAHPTVIDAVALVITLSILDRGGRRAGRTLEEVGRMGPFISFNKDTSKRFTDEYSSRKLDLQLARSVSAVSAIQLENTSECEREISGFLTAMRSEYGSKALIVQAAIVSYKWFLEDERGFPFSQILAEIDAVVSRKSPEVWRQFLVGARTGGLQVFALKCFLAFADDEIFTCASLEFSALADDLSSDSFEVLANGYETRSIYSSPKEELISRLSETVVERISARAGVLLELIASDQVQDLVFEKLLAPYDLGEAVVCSARREAAWKYAIRHAAYWTDAVDLISRDYMASSFEDFTLFGLEVVELPLREAARITAEPSLYPLSLVAAAERTRAKRSRLAAEAIGSIADRERWFAE